jgi:hypothetical protein
MWFVANAVDGEVHDNAHEHQLGLAAYSAAYASARTGSGLRIRTARTCNVAHAARFLRRWLY